MKDDEYTNLSQTELLNMFRQQQATNQQLLLVIEDLRAQLNKFQCMLFGQSSERKPTSIRKPDKEDNAAPDKSIKPKLSTQDAKIKNGRKKLPEELPRTVIKHELSEDDMVCSKCKSYKLHMVGKDISEQLEYIPCQLQVIEHRCYKYGCRNCKSITTAKMPDQPIDKGLAGPGLLADVIISKYQDHMPLYRQEKRYERLGYPIARSTLCDWVTASSTLLEPIVNRMHEDMLLCSPKIHSDDTIIPVQNNNKTHNGRLWVYIGGGGHAPPCVIFKYTKTRRGSEPKNFLGAYRGYLQADAYAGYDQCYKSGDIIEAGCFAHARRKFVDAAKVIEDDRLAQAVIDRIAKLYVIEKQAKHMTDTERYYYRKRYARPILKRLYKWLCLHQNDAPPKSPLGKAIAYMLNHWKALNNYMLDGVLDIDNNAAERAIRPVVLGRKNYLFAGSHEGAERAANIYSIIETCKLLGINTFEYLTDVLRRLPTTLNRDLDTLLPYNWKPKND